MSRDVRIARKKPSRDAFLRANLLGFFFSPAVQKWPMTRHAARVLTLWPDMLKVRGALANGVYELPASGIKFRQIGR